MWGGLCVCLEDVVSFCGGGGVAMWQGFLVSVGIGCCSFFIIGIFTVALCGSECHFLLWWGFSWEWVGMAMWQLV